MLNCSLDLYLIPRLIISLPLFAFFSEGSPFFDFCVLVASKETTPFVCTCKPPRYDELEERAAQYNGGTCMPRDGVCWDTLTERRGFRLLH